MKKYKMTLIEILGVIAIIVILALIGIGVYSMAADSSREKATAATIERLSNGLTKLVDKKISGLRTTGDNTNNGYVAVKLDSANRKVYFGNSVIGKDDEEQQEAFKIFSGALSAENIDSVSDKDGYIADGWQNKIYIRYPGKFNKGNFDIISAGSDGVFGEDGSEKIPTDMAKYKDDEGDLICDDVANFL